MSRVSNALPQHVLTDTNQVTDGQNVGTLGDRHARPGLGQRIKRAVSNFVSDIGTKFRALTDRVATAYHNKVLKHNTASANLAANKLATALARGKSDESITPAMMSLIKKAGRLDRNDPDGKAIQLLHSAISNLSPEDKASLSDDSRDWDSLGTRLKTEVDNRFVRLEHVCEGLAQMSGEHKPDPQEFQDEANSYKDSIDAIISDLKVETSNLRQEVLLARLPDGMTIDQQGFVGGTIQLTTTPLDSVKLQPEQRGVSVEEAVSHTINLNLAPKAYTKTTNTFHGVDVPSQSYKDIYRLDLRITNDNGVYQSRNDTEKSQGERTKTAISELKQLAGDDVQTTRVLAGALTQSVLRIFHDSLTTPDGKAVNAIFCNKEKIPDAKMQTPNGLVSFGRVTNYGAAVWNITKDPNGDFKVVIDWPMYIVGTGTGSDDRGMTELPFPVGANVIKSEFHAEYIIDANAARNGQLQISLPTPPTVTFSGGLDV